MKKKYRLIHDTEKSLYFIELKRWFKWKRASRHRNHVYRFANRQEAIEAINKLILFDNSYEIKEV